MSIGPLTASALTFLHKNKTTLKYDSRLAVEIRDCELVKFAQELYDGEVYFHPLIQVNFAPIQRLTLINSGLLDGHLALLREKVTVFQSLDISQNHFTGEGVLHFL